MASGGMKVAAVVVYRDGSVRGQESMIDIPLMSKRIIKSSALTQPTAPRNPAHTLTSVEFARTLRQTPGRPASDVAVAPTGNTTSDSVLQQPPLVWRYKD